MVMTVGFRTPRRGMSRVGGCPTQAAARIEWEKKPGRCRNELLQNYYSRSKKPNVYAALRLVGFAVNYGELANQWGRERPATGSRVVGEGDIFRAPGDKAAQVYQPRDICFVRRVWIFHGRLVAGQV